MAEMPRQLTQAEIDRILFNQRMGIQSTPPSIQNLQQRTSGTITPVAPNVAQLAAGGASRVGQFLNQILPNAQQVVELNPMNLERLFPTTAQPQVTIPTGFNFAPKQAPTGEVIPGGLQSQQVDMNQLLKAIQPADVLGVSGAQRAYTDVGYGRMPQPMDVAETMALGAGGLAAGRGLLKAGKGLPVGMSIQEATGLLQTAPKSDIGFYSAVEQAAMASPRKSATGQAFLNDIMKGPDVRADEIKWIGLDEFLKNKQNVTKQEVQDYIANNRVNVQEIRSTIPRLPGEEMPGDKGAFLPKFGQYTLPGGENYRELLLTMPAVPEKFNKLNNIINQKIDALADQGINLADLPDTDIRRIEIDKLAQEREKIPFRQSYKSPHFPQENILAHLRVNDRVDADGKKMLLIEEVQSDWHQAGREKGYGKQPQYAEGMEGREEGFLGMKEGVPDAPFKDTWYQLALKRAIQHAAENGYDRIGLTTGSQQAARFDLSKQVDAIKYNKMPDGRIFWTAEKDGQRVTGGDNAPNELDAVVGKEVAQRIRDGAESGKPGQLTGIDLQVGGEGMKKYYDEIYPKFLDKYGKKWGARVGETKIRTQSDKQAQEDLDLLEQLGEDRSKFSGSGMAKVRYIDITPEMKAGVSKGQPLFQAAPIIGTGLLGSQQEER